MSNRKWFLSVVITCILQSALPVPRWDFWTHGKKIAAVEQPESKEQEQMHCSKECTEVSFEASVKDQKTSRSCKCNCEIKPVSGSESPEICFTGRKRLGTLRSKVSAAAKLSVCAHGSQLCIKVVTVTGSVRKGPGDLVLELLRASFRVASASGKGSSTLLRSDLTLEGVPVQTMRVPIDMLEEITTRGGEWQLGPSVTADLGKQSGTASLGYVKNSWETKNEKVAAAGESQDLVHLRKGNQCANGADEVSYTIELARNWPATYLTGQKDSAQVRCNTQQHR